MLTLRKGTYFYIAWSSTEFIYIDIGMMSKVQLTRRRLSI